jgi:hypothetical protein
MKQPKEFGLIKQSLREIKDVKKHLIRVEAMLAGEQLKPQEWKEIERARAEIRKGEYVTLEQLKRELRIK